MARLVKDVITVADGVEVRPEDLADFNKRRQAAMAEAYRRFNEREQALHTGKYCPIQVDDGSVRECKTDCAFYRGGVCALSKRPHETAGRRCPLTGRACGDYCQAYRDGCTLA